jgi:type I restriction enzyme R subunit
VRKLIIDEQPVNPKYYEQMSKLLDALIAQRKEEALDYQAYLVGITDLARRSQRPWRVYPVRQHGREACSL